MFPPLKSCLGGVNALIKHYDVCPHQITPLYLSDEFFTANTGHQRQAGRPSPLGDQIGGQSDETQCKRQLQGSGEMRLELKKFVLCIWHPATQN